MLIGFSGASRSGKTTLGLEIEKSNPNSYTFQKFETIKSTNKPIVSEISLSDRIDAQNDILNSFEDQISSLPSEEVNLIDRTPLDFITYLLCDCNMTNSSVYANEIEKYYNRCISLINREFHQIFLLDPIPGIYVEEEGKPKKNGAYQLHYATTIRGTAHDPEIRIPVTHIPGISIKERIYQFKLRLYTDHYY